jgi:hypothetical protein
MADIELPEHVQAALHRALELHTSAGLQQVIATAVNLSFPPVNAEVVGGAERAWESWRHQFAFVIAPAIEQWQLPTSAVPHLSERRAELRGTIDAAWRRLMPGNWVGLAPDEVAATIEQVAETGFSLVWLPRVEIVRELLSADPQATATVLVAHRDEILSDAEECLDGVVEPKLQLMRVGVEKSILALRDGHDWAAQALASAVFTSEAHTLLGRDLNTIKNRMGNEHPDAAGINRLRLRTIYLAGAKALKGFDPKGERGRAAFNRHNSAHRITAKQWNEANALSAIMLAASFLREIEYWYPLLVRDEPDASA